MKNDIADEFDVEDDSVTNPVSGMLSNIFAAGSNLITRQRRSPDDNSVATSKFRLPLMLTSWFTKKPDVKVEKEAQKASQSNEIVNDTISPPSTNKNNYGSWNKIFSFKKVNTVGTQTSEQVKDASTSKNVDDNMLISVPIKDTNQNMNRGNWAYSTKRSILNEESAYKKLNHEGMQIFEQVKQVGMNKNIDDKVFTSIPAADINLDVKKRNWLYSTKRSSLNEENANKKLNIEDTQTSEQVKNSASEKNKGDEMLTSISAKDSNPYAKTNRPYSTEKSALSEDNAQKEQQSNNYYLSPYTIMSNMLPPNANKEVMTNLWKIYNNPENQSYLNSVIMFARIMSFFMPGLGVVDQINFSIAMSKIVWKVANMYSQGSSMKDIALTVGPDAATAYLVRCLFNGFQNKYYKFVILFKISCVQ